MVDEIAATAALTDRPFGVDLLTAAPQDMAAKVAAIIDGGATVFVAGLGVPREVVEQCHDGGLLVVNMCGKVAHAVQAVDAGCDIVVAQGTEAGGHTGQIATMALVPQVVDAVGEQVPVVAAGGIFDGRGLAAALSLGADGIWVGTRFIATPEAQAVAGLQGPHPRIRRGRHADHPRLHRQDLSCAAQLLHRRVRARRRRRAALSGAVPEVARGRRQPPGRRRADRRSRPRPGVHARGSGHRAPSTSWSQRATWFVVSSPRPKQRWTAWLPSAEGTDALPRPGPPDPGGPVSPTAP